jgi:hypothetical protein
MLHRIDIAIFDVADVIRLIPDEVFPKSPLPDTALTAGSAYITQAFSLRKYLCEARFYQPPAHRKISIVWRQRPYCVNMIRQDDEGVDDEWIIIARSLHGVAQRIDMIDK